MPSLRHIAHQILPHTLVSWIQKKKKTKRNKSLAKQAKSGGFGKEDLVEQLKLMGIQEGDVVLVHSALSKMGYVQNGPKTVVESLLEVLGNEGHLLMPTSPNNGRQFDFMQTNPVFDVMHSPSKMGAISEYFRKLPGIKRSLHPTESVACLGPDAEEFVRGHFGALTAYQADSPFGKVIEKNGKILMIGVTFDNAGTNVHCFEDAVDFPYPIYHSDIFDAEVIDENGEKHQVQTKIHNPEWSAKRYCDFLIPVLENDSILSKHKFGEAETLVVDAKAMFEKMKDLLKEGKTIYRV
jgi:aminoglycoside 3-N-acetyltransferase